MNVDAGQKRRTHPAPRPATRTAVKTVAWAVPLALVLGSGGYVAAVAAAPLPEPEFTLSGSGSATIETDSSVAQAAVDARSLPTAIGWLDGSDDAVWSNNDETHSLGSITKLIMVLASFEQFPLAPGAEGETYAWTEEEAARTAEYFAIGGVAYNIPVGAELTQRDMLKLIFLPSANDVAHAYALWAFGSNEAFLEALEGWKTKHGLHSISLVEPTGLYPDDRASAADLVRVARLALQSPTVREFTSMQSAEMPWGIGTIENSNPLLGEMPGVLGLKTGTIYSSYNLVAAQETDVNGRPGVKIAVTLDRPTKDERAASGRTLLNAMEDLSQAVTVVEKGELIGTLTGPAGDVVDVVAGGSAAAELLPSESASRTVSIGAEGGVITVESPAGTVEVPVVLTGTLAEPDLWWRITHPGALF